MEQTFKINFTTKPSLKTAFTLIELLTVMAIIIAMGSITVAAYFAMMRGTGVRSSVGHLRSTLLMARQWAVLENKPAYVLFGVDSSDTNSMWYVPIGQAGTINFQNNDIIGDRYGDMSMFTNGSPIYNMSKSTVPQGVVTESYPPGSTIQPEGVKVSFWAMRVDGAGFLLGNRYGYPIGNTNGLPRGFLFGDGSYALPDPEVVAFGSDGTLREFKNGSLDLKPGPQTISMFEIMNPTRIFKVKVNGPSGLIDVVFPN